MQFTGIIKKAGVLPLLALTLALGLTACSKAPAQAAESMSHPAVQQTAESASQPATGRSDLLIRRAACRGKNSEQGSRDME